MSQSEVVIERLEDFTRADVRELNVLRQHMSPLKEVEPFTESVIEDIVSTPETSVFIVARGDLGRIVGSETLNLNKSPEFPGGRMAWLGFVSTHNECRRQGIFGKVWKEGLGWCDEREIYTMQFTSNPNNPDREIARTFYLAHGAIIKDTDIFSLDVQAELAQTS